MSVKYIKKLKLILVIISIFLSVAMPVTCISLYPNFNLEKQAVSHFGVHENTQNIFTLSLILISFGVYVNNKERVNGTFAPSISKWLTIPLLISTLSLSGVGLFDMYNFIWLHNLFAGAFFLFYGIFVIMFGIYDVKYNMRRGFMSILFAFLMFLATILIGLYSGLAPFEFTFMFLMVLWNIIILPVNRFRSIA